MARIRYNGMRMAEVPAPSLKERVKLACGFIGLAVLIICTVVRGIAERAYHPNIKLRRIS